MVRVLSLSGYTVWVFKEDAASPRVTVLSAHGIARFSLGASDQDVRAIKWSGMEDWDLRRAAVVVRTNRSRLLREWEALHGSRD